MNLLRGAQRHPPSAPPLEGTPPLVWPWSGLRIRARERSTTPPRGVLDGGGRRVSSQKSFGPSEPFSVAAGSGLDKGQSWLRQFDLSSKAPGRPLAVPVGQTTSAAQQTAPPAAAPAAPPTTSRAQQGRAEIVRELVAALAKLAHNHVYTEYERETEQLPPGSGCVKPPLIHPQQFGIYLSAVLKANLHHLDTMIINLDVPSRDGLGDSVENIVCFPIEAWCPCHDKPKKVSIAVAAESVAADAGYSQRGLLLPRFRKGRREMQDSDVDEVSPPVCASVLVFLAYVAWSQKTLQVTRCAIDQNGTKKDLQTLTYPCPGRGAQDNKVNNIVHTLHVLIHETNGTSVIEYALKTPPSQSLEAYRRSIASPSRSSMVIDVTDSPTAAGIS